MEAQEILATLQQRGATVRALQDGRLEVAPRRVLDDDLRAAIRSHKRELLAELAQREDSAEAAALESGVPSKRGPARASRRQIVRMRIGSGGSAGGPISETCPIRSSRRFAITTSPAARSTSSGSCASAQITSNTRMCC